MASLSIVAPDIHYALKSSAKAKADFFKYDNYAGRDMAGGYGLMDGSYGIMGGFYG